MEQPVWARAKTTVKYNRSVSTSVLIVRGLNDFQNELLSLQRACNTVALVRKLNCSSINGNNNEGPEHGAGKIRELVKKSCLNEISST